MSLPLRPRRDMLAIGMNRPHWMSVTIHSRSEEDALNGRLRLVMLFHWLRNEAPPQVVVRDQAGNTVSDPLRVDWANFPLNEAIEAIVALNHATSHVRRRPG
jgi:hypothetical protein